MSTHLSALLALGLACLAPAPSPAATFTATEMMKLRRLADPQVSPDGSRVAFALTEVDLAGGKRNTDLWLVPVAGGEPRRITSSPASDSRPRWSPDGDADRLPLHARRLFAGVGARPRRRRAAQAHLARDRRRTASSGSTRRRLLVVAEVFPDCGADDACNAKTLGEAGKPSSARVYDDLLFRHWDTWDDGRRNHLLVVPLDGGAAVDLTPGGDDAPPFSLGGEDWSRVARRAGGLLLAQGRGRTRPGARTPTCSWCRPRAARRSGSPTRRGLRRRLPLQPGRQPPRLAHAAARRLRGRPLAARGLDRKTRRRSATLTESFDRHVESFAFSPDSKTIYFTAEEAGRSPVFSVPAAGGPVTTVLGGRHLRRPVGPARRQDARGDAGHAHPPRGDRPLRRRTGRASPRVTHVERRVPRRLRPARRRERHLHRRGRARASRPGW